MMPQVWKLYNSVLPEKSRSTLIQLIPIKSEPNSPTTACRQHIHPSNDVAPSDCESETDNTFTQKMRNTLLTRISQSRSA